MGQSIRDQCEARLHSPNGCPYICPTWVPYRLLAGFHTGGGGGTLIFSYIRRVGSFFGFKILNFNIFGGFQKNEYFWGYEDFVDMFWGHHKFGLYLGGISMHLRVFS